MINFCTLFDSNYLTRGLALNESLHRVCPSYHLYVIAFDDRCYEYLHSVNLPNLTPIRLQDFEDEKLLSIKPSRSAAEYCWTCTPSVILYCIEKFNLPSCTYIDADMIFYHDPQVLLDEMGTDSVLISEHRYTKEYAWAGTASGIYCVQFMCFKNDGPGMTALRWWRERCLEWCYDRIEDGKFGDQKYLDDWPQRFRGVHVMQHPGGGIAPWNIQQYELSGKEDRLFVKPLSGNKVYPLIFFHFHGLKFYTNGFATCSGTLYDLSPDVKQMVYIPYLENMLCIGARLHENGVSFGTDGARAPAPGKGRVFRSFLKELASLYLSGKISPFRSKNYNFSRHYHFINLERLTQ